MFRLIGLVVSIGLADSLNPSTVGPALYLATGRHPRRAIAEFTAGVFAVFVLGGLVLTVGPGRAILSLVPRPGPTVRYILETIAGVVMLIAAGIVWLKRGSLGARKREEKQRQRRSPFLMGVTISVVELPTAFPYFAVVVAIVGSGFGLVHQIVLVVVYNACFVLPLLGMIVTLAVAGDRATRILLRAREFLQRRWPILVAALALVAGVFVTTLGVTGLTSQTDGRLGHFSRRLRHLITHP